MRYLVSGEQEKESITGLKKTSLALVLRVQKQNCVRVNHVMRTHFFFEVFTACLLGGAISTTRTSLVIFSLTIRIFGFFSASSSACDINSIKTDIIGYKQIDTGFI